MKIDFFRFYPSNAIVFLEDGTHFDLYYHRFADFSKEEIKDWIMHGEDEPWSGLSDEDKERILDEILINQWYCD